MRKVHFLLGILFAILSFSIAAQTLQITTDHPDAFYHKGETVEFRIRGGSGTADYVVVKNGAGMLSSGTVALGEKPAVVKASLDEPGFLRCDVTMKSDATTKPQTISAGVAVDPTLIKPSLPPPDDFDAYWNQQKKLLADEPMKPVLTAIASPDDQVEAYDVQINCPGGAPVSGYLALPKNAQPKSLAAILYPHAAGVNGSSLAHAIHGARLGMIAFDFNAHGIPNGKPASFYADLANGALKDYASRGITEDRDKVYFRGMYLRLLRAIDYLTTRPEWDGKIMIVEGSSQGGGQAIVAAALDPRVTLCLAAVPALCDQTGFKADRACGWPRIVPRDANGKYDEKATENARYFDAMNFASRIKCNTFFIVGFNDQTSPPSSVYAAYNAITGDNKQIYPQPRMGHAFPPELQDEFDERIYEHVLVRTGRQPAQHRTKAYNPPPRKRAKRTADNDVIKQHH